MDASFWHDRWAQNQIAFHQSDVNPLLVRHFPKLSLEQGSRIFVPLCGKTLDIAWLLSKGYQVSGAELSELAIRQLFEQLGVTPQISMHGTMQKFSGSRIDIFVGDIFHLTAEILGPVDSIYDRAALVALPAHMRNRYTHHLMALTDRASQLLITFDYDQSLQAGPPFSVVRDEIDAHYGKNYEIKLAESVLVPGGLKGKCEAMEQVWVLA